MSKGHMQDLQGFRTISSPSASPVDAYGGGVNAPKVSAADQLADAFGTVSKYGQKAAVKAQQDRDELLKLQQDAAYNRAKSEADNGIVTAVKMKEMYAQNSEVVVSEIVQKQNQNESYNTYLSQFSKIPDEIALSEGDLANYFIEEEAKLRERMGDTPFATAGALSGFRAAKREVMRGILNKQDAYTRKKSTQNIQDSVHIALSKFDTSTLEGSNSAVAAIAEELDVQFNDSPNAPEIVNQDFVDAFITYAKNNPTKPVLQLLEDKQLSHLYTKTTRRKLDGLPGELADLSLQEQERVNKQLEANFRDSKPKLEAEAYNLVLSNPTKAREYLNAPIPKDATDLQIKQFRYTQQLIKIELETDTLDPELSNRTKNDLIETIKSAATTGDYTALGFEAGVVPTNDQIREIISLNPDMKGSDKNILRDNLESLRNGYESVSDSKLRSHIATRFKIKLNEYTNDQFGVRTMLNAAGINAQQIIEDTYITTMREELDKHFQSGDYTGGIPQGDAFTTIQNTAYEAVFQVIKDLDGLLSRQPAQGQNKIDMLRQFDANLDAPKYEIGDIVDDEKTGLPIARVVGINTDGTYQYAPLETEESEAPEEQEVPVVEDDPRYKVTKDTEYIQNFADEEMEASRLEKQLKREAEATKAGFDKESATITLDDSVKAQLDKLVSGRYKRAAKNTRGGGPKDVSEDAIMDIVLDQLGLDGNSDFEYGGIFGDSADTAGEIAVKKIVDSLMEKHKGD